MSDLELVDGWATATIGDMIGPDGIFNDGDWIESKDQDPDGDVRLVQLADVGDGRYVNKSLRFMTLSRAKELGCTFLADGDLLIARMPDPLGRACLFPGDPKKSVTVVDVCVVRTGKSGVTHSWLASAVNSPQIRQQTELLASGTTRSRISRGNLATVEFPVPPLPEQVRIVAKLEALTENSRRAKEALDAIPPLLERFRQSVLASAFRGDLTAAWRAKNPDAEPADKLLQRIRTERRRRWEEAELAKMQAKGKTPGDDRWKEKYKEPEPADAEGLPDLPEGWCLATVEELSTKAVDGVHQKPDYVTAGVPFLTVKNLTAGPGISFDDVNYVSAIDHAELVKNTLPERGDILISKDGTLGVTRLIRTDRPFSIFVSLALVKPVLRDMGEYLEMAFVSPYFQERFKRTGTGIQHIHLGDLRRVALPVAPAAEQDEIVRRCGQMMERIDKFKSVHLDASGTLGGIDRSILAKAFRGDLVPQDPADEPASVLLARIRAERAAAALAKDTKKPPKRPR
jgi:type I restriction enzyme S subunit